MNLIDKPSGKQLNGKILRVAQNEMTQLKNNKSLVFDWSIESKNQVYKLILVSDEKLLGLISLIDSPEEFRIHINLLESAKEYRGKAKSISNIPGCLIAFACKLAFKRGYEGFVSLTPKTQLIDYYQHQFGFLPFGKDMAVFENISEAIIQKYLGNEKI